MPRNILRLIAWYILLLLHSQYIHNATSQHMKYIRGKTYEDKTNNVPTSLPSTRFFMTSSSSSEATGRLTYNHGPLISQVKVILILWGGSSKVRYASNLQKFYSAIVTKSDWFYLLSQEYSTVNQTIDYGSLYFTYSFNLAPIGRIVSRDEIERHIQHLMDQGSIPPPDVNTYYAIHLAPKTSPNDFCIYSCAWHSSFLYNGDTNKTQQQQLIYYGVIPDQDSCPNGCGTGLSSLFSTTSHELAEAITDPTGEGWMDRTMYAEVADLCWDNGTTMGSDGKVYVIQQIWSNSKGTCESGMTIPTIRPTRKPLSPRKSPSKKKY